MMSWILFAFLFGAVVFIHELGHFMVAKLSGVRVDRFALGFGPALLKKRFGETEYAILAFPLGGYVKMHGEDPDDLDPNEPPDPRSFAGKSPYIRIAIAAMGPIANLILPIALFTVIFMIGIPTLPSIVGAVFPGSPADKAGLRSGDLVKKVDGQKVWKWEEGIVKKISARPGMETSLLIDRQGKELTLSITPDRELDKNAFGEDAFVGKIGVAPVSYRPSIGLNNPNSRAAKAGLQTGDIITAVNGKEITYWWQLEERFNAASKTKELSVERPMGPALQIASNSAAEQAGLQTGDAVVSVNGAITSSWCSFDKAFVSTKGPRTVGVLRAADKTGKSWAPVNINVPAQSTNLSNAGIERMIEPRMRTMDLKLNAKSLAHAGIQSGELFISDINSDSVACEKNLMHGDQLLSLNDTPIQSWHRFRETIVKNKGEAIVLGISRGGKTQTIELIPQEKTNANELTGQKQKVRLIGIIAALSQNAPTFGTERYLNPFRAMYHAVLKTYQLSRMTLIGLSKVFTGKIELTKSVGGPITIFYLAGGSYETGGWIAFFHMMALLSITLGLINLLPIPVLDGGHIMFSAIEALKGSPVSMRIRELSQQVGLVLLLGLMVLTFYVDINRYFVDRIKDFFN